MNLHFAEQAVEIAFAFVESGARRHLDDATGARMMIRRCSSRAPLKRCGACACSPRRRDRRCNERRPRARRRAASRAGWRSRSAEDGKSYRGDHLSATIEQLVRKAGLADCGWHSLRHSFGSRLAMRGAPLFAIKELMGHANIGTTQRYLHTVPGTTAQAIALLSLARGCHAGSNERSDDSEAAVVIQFKMSDPNVQRAFQNLNVRIPLKFQALVRDEKPKLARKRRSSTVDN